MLIAGRNSNAGGKPGGVRPCVPYASFPLSETFEQLGVWTLGWSPCAEGSNRNRIQSGSALPSRSLSEDSFLETKPATQ